MSILHSRLAFTVLPDMLLANSLLTSQEVIVVTPVLSLKCQKHVVTHMQKYSFDLEVYGAVGPILHIRIQVPTFLLHAIGDTCTTTVEWANQICL